MRFTDYIEQWDHCLEVYYEDIHFWFVNIFVKEKMFFAEFINDLIMIVEENNLDSEWYKKFIDDMDRYCEIDFDQAIKEIYERISARELSESEKQEILSHITSEF